MKKTVRLAGIAYESLVNGPGIRRVFFAQGCKHNCKGCFNPETHSFDKGIVLEIDKLIKDVLENPMITGVTFSGGDPIEQAHSFSYMAKILKNKGLNIWCYTGYTFEKLLDKMKENKDIRELLNNIDVLVDGKFEINNKKEELKKAMEENLTALVGKIPGLLTLEFVACPFGSSTHDMALVSTFEKEEDISVYAKHPAHVAVADTYVRPFVTERACLDY